jgi:hypothetical protein
MLSALEKGGAQSLVIFYGNGPDKLTPSLVGFPISVHHVEHFLKNCSQNSTNGFFAAEEHKKHKEKLFRLYVFAFSAFFCG